MNSDRMDGEHFGIKSFKPTTFSVCVCVCVCVCVSNQDVFLHDKLSTVTGLIAFSQRAAYNKAS